VAPATARVIGKYAAGISDDLLTAILLATRAPVVVCPAMHTEMWEHPAVQDNVAVLRRRGVTIVDPGVGRLAGGDEGAGRLAEPKRPGQVLVGFAAETERVREQARAKLRGKGLDLLVANDVSAPGAGFEHDTNRVVVLDATGNEQDVPLTDKREVARIVF